MRELAEMFGMSNQQLNDFILWQYQHGKMLNIRNDMEGIENLMMVTRRQFLVDAFRLIVGMWESRRMSQVSLDKVGQLRQDLDDGIFSALNLKIIWRCFNLTDTEVQSLQSVFVKSHVFIPWKERNQEGNIVAIKSIVPPLQPPVWSSR